ncbi:MAG: AMP-binding enzyme [Tabrizicola sp.]
MLGPTGHLDSFTRDRLPPAEDWPRIDLTGFDYPDFLNVAVALTDRMVEKGFGDHVALIGKGRSRTYRVMLKAIDKGVDLSSLRAAVLAGETLPATICEEWRAGIGVTEMLHIFVSNRFDDHRPGCTGKPVTGYEARIVDDAMVERPRREVGRLAVRGPTGCRYLADARQRANVRDGWNLTGDAFWQDEDGCFHFAARTDDMILSAGYNITGPEVEAALLQHPAVLECAVVGAPDPERGQIVEAHVVLAPGHRGDALMVKLLQDHVKRVIAPFKYPRRVIFTEALPKTRTGKIQRFQLRSGPSLRP